METEINDTDEDIDENAQLEDGNSTIQDDGLPSAPLSSELQDGESVDSSPEDIDLETEDETEVAEDDEEKDSIDEALENLETQTEESPTEFESPEFEQEELPPLPTQLSDSNHPERMTPKRIMSYAEMELLGLADLFSPDEVGAISQYVSSSVPLSNLNNLLILTDNPLDKSTIYIAVHRIITSARNYITDVEVKRKLQFMLDKQQEIYNDIYSLVTKMNATNVAFMRHNYMHALIVMMTDKGNRDKMNPFIDLFFLFAEKQTKHEIDKTTGLDLETEEGREVYKALFATK